MAFQVTDAFREGFDGIASERGAVLAAVYVLLGLVNTVLTQTALEGAIRTAVDVYDVPPDAFREAGGIGALAPLSLGVPLPVTAALLLVVAVIGFPVLVVTIRAFASESPELLPAEATEGLAKATVLLFLTRLLAGIAIGIGTVLFVIPGLVLFVFFYFAEQEIALNDAGVVEALKNSLDITTDNALGVVVLIVALFFLGVAVGIPLTLLSGVLPTAVGQVLSSTVSAVVTVFGIATVTNAYQQAVADDNDGMDPDAVETTV